MGIMNFFDEVSIRINNGEISNKDDLQALKLQLSRKYSLDHIPSDSEILNTANINNEFKKLLRIKPTRTVSGVAVVAAMTSPEICPHGRCIFCPGGVENNSPQAYTGYEPSALRGRANQYDPYNIVFNRLKQLETIGHDTSKVDLIIMGGTFTARTREYQESYVKGCIDAMNGFVAENLEAAMAYNETAGRRCIGLTVETKPDWFFEKEIDLSLDYGATKVELGAQIINDRVLKMNMRGHGISEIIKSTQLSRDAGFKIVYHLMPGMPGASYEDDLKSFREMMSNEDYMPDMLKIYPTLVVKGTKLYNMWKNGEYQPMDTSEGVSLISTFMNEMPPWVRVQRMQRDIPVKFIEAGVKRSDLRNLVELQLSTDGKRSMEIRGREVGVRDVKSGDFKLIRREYNASGSKEIFLSFENSDDDISGFIRLRKPSAKSHRSEMKGSSIIREIKVLGNVVPVGQRTGEGFQHKGIGRNLLDEAERISRDEWNMERILVISGIGVREYFRKFGYERVGPYMGKKL
jgi:elongator complex protein 3